MTSKVCGLFGCMIGRAVGVALSDSSLDGSLLVPSWLLYPLLLSNFQEVHLIDMVASMSNPCGARQQCHFHRHRV